uniref:Uncharacterized protein n=1 Tax=Timema bartmani TaxID=61472 RepID=A0A7R9HWH4_9NEOP|nr:unnamed protein product [Timema bartmani]
MEWASFMCETGPFHFGLGGGAEPWRRKAWTGAARRAVVSKTPPASWTPPASSVSFTFTSYLTLHCSTMVWAIRLGHSVIHCPANSACGTLVHHGDELGVPLGYSTKRHVSLLNKNTNAVDTRGSHESEKIEHYIICRYRTEARKRTGTTAHRDNLHLNECVIAAIRLSGYPATPQHDAVASDHLWHVIGDIDRGSKTDDFTAETVPASMAAWSKAPTCAIYWTIDDWGIVVLSRSGVLRESGKPFWKKTTLSGADWHLNPDLLVIGSLVHERDACSDHSVTEAGLLSVNFCDIFLSRLG